MQKKNTADDIRAPNTILQRLLCLRRRLGSSGCIDPDGICFAFLPTLVLAYEQIATLFRPARSTADEDHR